MAIRFASPRLLLREFLPEDALPLYQLYADPEVLRFTGDVPFKPVKEAVYYRKMNPFSYYNSQHNTS